MPNHNPHESPAVSSLTESADAATVRISGDDLRTRDYGEQWYWPLWAVVGAFGAYFCMYMFRKPFGAAEYKGTELWGIDFKTVLVTAQVFGYMLSKFIGIKVISELPPRRRALGILVLALCAELAMVLFAIVPRPWNAICLFLQGLPLGMVFGLVLGGLEGRRQTEALTAGLCASFILAGGFAKSVGTWLLASGVSEEWMPAAAGALFVLPIAIFSGMIWLLPPPTKRDVAARSERTTMDGRARGEFLRRYGVGLLPIVVMFILVTILRSIRDDFAPEIWKGLGYATEPATFTQSEFWVTLGVMLSSGLAVVIINNRQAFFAALAICITGFVMLLTALALHSQGAISPFKFMVLIGLGLYLPYVAVHTTIFERLLAMTRDRGTIGYLMYVADALGYLAYVGVMIARNFITPSDNVLTTLLRWSWITAVVSIVCMIVCWLFFSRKSYAPSTVPMEVA